MVKQTVDFVFICTLGDRYGISISNRTRCIIGFNIDMHDIAGIEVGCREQSEASAADKVRICIRWVSVVIPTCDIILNITGTNLQPLYTGGKIKAFVIIASFICRVVISSYRQNIGSEGFSYLTFVFRTSQIRSVFVLLNSCIFKCKAVISAEFIRKSTAYIFLHVLVPSYAKTVIGSQLKFRGNVTHCIVGFFVFITACCITFLTIIFKYRIIVVKKNGRYRSNGVKILL